SVPRGDPGVGEPGGTVVLVASAVANGKEADGVLISSGSSVGTSGGDVGTLEVGVTSCSSSPSSGSTVLATPGVASVCNG
ncbi:MAG: hypothetical protein M3P51_17535, partial [Chloroflexota bacterium]|nr:hypothetical protein [Chloroflexota bacterium]